MPRDTLPPALDLRKQVATTSRNASAWLGNYSRHCKFLYLCPAANSSTRQQTEEHICPTLHLHGAVLPKRTSTSYNIMISRLMPRKVLAARLCAVQAHFAIIQQHDAAVNAAQNARGQTRGPHFLRACAVETHFNIIQHHDCAANTTQNACGHFLRACAIEMHFDIMQHHDLRKIPRNVLAARLVGLIFCEPAQSKRTSTPHNITILR